MSEMNAVNGTVEAKPTGKETPPLYVGTMGAALGLGAGLVLAEFVVPGIVLGALAIGGLSAGKKIAPSVKRWLGYKTEPESTPVSQ